MADTRIWNQSRYVVHLWHLKGDNGRALCGIEVSNDTKRLIEIPDGHRCPKCTKLAAQTPLPHLLTSALPRESAR